MRPVRDLGLCHLQAIAHVVERLRQFAHFIVRVHRNLVAQVAAGHVLGAGFQFAQRIANHDPDEQAAQEDHGDQGHAGRGKHLAALLRQALVDLGQRQIGIEHTQDLDAGWMRMASCIGTRRLVLDGGDNAEHAASIGPIHPEAVGAIEARQRLRFRVAAVAGFGALIDGVAHLGRRRGVADHALRIHDANPHHARLVGHVQHHFVQADAVVVQHVMRSAAAQDFALLLGADQSRVFQMFALVLNAEVAEQPEDDDHDHEDRDHQFCADASSQAL